MQTLIGKRELSSQRRKGTAQRRARPGHRDGRFASTESASSRNGSRGAPPIEDEHDLVFCREDGDADLAAELLAVVRAHVREAGLPAIRFHDLRHTHATLALAAGVHPKVVSERLGHATVAITLDTYSHAIPAMQEDAAAKLRRYSGANGCNRGCSVVGDESHKPLRQAV